MVVNYDIEDGWSNLLDIFKGAPKITDEVKQALENLSTKTIFSAKTAEDLGKQIGYTDQKFFEFAKQADLSGDLLQQYTDYMRLGTSAAKKFGAAIKSIGANMAIMLAINAAITIAYKVWDHFAHAEENAKKEMDEAVAAYEENKSELDSINKELEKNKKLIEELSSKDNLTYTEEAELQKLIDINEQLSIQQKLKEKLDDSRAKEAVEESIEAYKKNYKSGAVTEDSLDEYRRLLALDVQAMGAYGVDGYSADEKNLSSMIAAYEGFIDLKNQALAEKNYEAADSYLTRADEIEASIWEQVEALQEYKDVMSAIPYNELGSNEQKVFDEISATIQNVWKLLDPAQFQQLQIDKLFNTEGIKVTKDQLIEMANAGTLTEKTLLEKYPKVVEALSGLNLTTEEGVSNIQVFLRWLRQEAKALGETSKQAENSAFSKSEMISKINGLSEGFESLDKVMNSIKDKDKPFDYALLDDKKFTETFSGLGETYTNFIEKVSNSPKDINACQSAFNDLVDAYVSGSEAMKGLSDETAELTVDMLKNMGVSNAQEIVMDALAQKHAEAAWNTNNLKEATSEEIIALANESEQSDQTRRSFQLYVAQKLLAEAALDVSGDITALQNIVQSLGIASNAWKSYYLARAEMSAMEGAATKTYDNGSTWKEYTYNGVNYAMSAQEYDKQLQKKTENLNKLQSDREKELDDILQKNAIPKYTGGPKTNSPGSNKDKSDKDNTKDIDWIERKLKLLEEKRSKLEEMASSDTLSYLGINTEDLAKAQEIIQKMNGDTAIATEEFQLLGDMARNAGMSINAFIDAVKNCGSESRTSALESLLQTNQALLEEYSKTAERYKEDYENALSQLPEGYREKIEGGADINDLGIETLPDKEAEKVQKVIDLYDKWQNAESNVSNAKKEIFSTEKEVYENEIESLQKRGDALENQNNLITKQVDYLNATGQNISATSYETLIANLKQQQSFLDQQLALKKQELQRLLELDPNFKNSPEYYALQESIQSAEESLIDLDTQQAEYYDTLRQLPVQNMQKLVDMYDSITTALQNYGNEIEAQGKTLDENYYQALIDNGAETINQLQEQADAVRDVMDEYEVGSDKWTEMYSKLQDINSSISGIVTNMHEWNQAILQIPLDRLSSLTENLEMVKDALSAVNEEQQTVVDSVTSVIDKQRESLEEAQKAEEQAIQDKIDALQDQMDLLDKQNEALELQIQKEQALKDLEDAKNQKKVRAIRDGKVVYEADKDAIANAQDKVQDANDAIHRNELEEQQEKLQDELEAIGKKYDELYEKLDKISDKWSKIPTDIEDAQNKELADRWLGEGWEDKVLNGTDEEIYEYFKQQFEQNSQQMDQYEDQIHASEQIQALVNTYLTAYRNGTITRDQAMTGIKGVLGTINSELTAGQNIQNILTYLSTQNNTGATTNDILTDTQNKMMETANQIMQSLDVYEQNSNTITGYMSSFGELTEHISDIRDTIYDVEDELDDNFDDLKDTLEDGFDDMVDALGEYRSRKDDDDDERPDKGGESHSTNKEPIYSGGSGGGSNSHWDDSDSGHGPGVRSASAFSLLSLDDDSDYIPVTQETYDKLFKPYENVKLTSSFQKIPEYTRTLTSIGYPSNTSNKQQIVNINMGDIKLEGVQDPDGFAKAIKTHLPSSIRQQLSKR